MPTPSLHKLAIRRCKGSREAWALIRPDFNPDGYAYCVTTSYSVETLMDHVLKQFGPTAVQLEIE